MKRLLALTTGLVLVLALTSLVSGTATPGTSTPYQSDGIGRSGSRSAAGGVMAARLTSPATIAVISPLPELAQGQGYGFRLFSRSRR